MTLRDHEVTAIGLVVRHDERLWLVPRVSHLDGIQGDASESVVAQHGIQLTGAVQATDPGGLVAVRGRGEESSLRVSDTRTSRVVDVFTYHPPVKVSATPTFARPSVTAEHEQWETHMLRTGEILSRRYIRAGNGSWQVVVAAQDVENVRTRLEHEYHDQLTLVQVEWSRHQFNAIRDELSSRVDEWKVTTLLDGTSEAGIPVLRIGLREVTRDIRAWHQALPPDMVELFPFISASTGRGDFDDESRDFQHLYTTSENRL